MPSALVGKRKKRKLGLKSTNMSAGAPKIKVGREVQAKGDQKKKMQVNNTRNTCPYPEMS